MLAHELEPCRILADDGDGGAIGGSVTEVAQERVAYRRRLAAMVGVREAKHVWQDTEARCGRSWRLFAEPEHAHPVAETRGIVIALVV
jgi:hypothetical protein